MISGLKFNIFPIIWTDINDNLNDRNHIWVVLFVDCNFCRLVFENFPKRVTLFTVRKTPFNSFLVCEDLLYYLWLVCPPARKNFFSYFFYSIPSPPSVPSLLSPWWAPRHPSCCWWSPGRLGLLQMIILRSLAIVNFIQRGRPLANDHLEGWASCKWSSVTSVTLVTSARIQILSRTFSFLYCPYTLLSNFFYYLVNRESWKLCVSGALAWKQLWAYLIFVNFGTPPHYLAL